MCFVALSKVSTNLHQFSQIRFVKMSVDLWIIFQESGRRACLSGQRASCALYYCCIRLRVRVNEVRLLSLGALRHHSSDCLRQRPSVGGYSSQFARTLLRLCFAKLLVLLVGGPDNATACAPYGARPVASGNLTTSSQVHLVAGASRLCVEINSRF